MTLTYHSDSDIYIKFFSHFFHILSLMTWRIKENYILCKERLDSKNKCTFRVAESPHEQTVSHVQSSPASSFWSGYWGAREEVHEYEYGEYGDYQENRVGRLVTKSRLDPRHVNMPGEEEARALSERGDTNALRLQSGGGHSHSDCLLLILSTALALFRL